MIERNFGSKVSKEELAEMFPMQSAEKIRKFMKSVGWESKSVHCPKLGKNVRKWCKPEPEDAAREFSKKKGATNNDVMLACIERGLDPAKIFNILRDYEADIHLPIDNDYSECVKMAREYAEKVITQDLGEYCRFSLTEKTWIKAGMLIVVMENLYPQLCEKKSYANAISKCDKLAPKIYLQAKWCEAIKFPSKIKWRWEYDEVIRELARKALNYRAELLDEDEIAKHVADQGIKKFLDIEASFEL